jgi:hypothetical protein
MARRQRCVTRFSIFEHEPLSLRSFFVTFSDVILIVREIRETSDF